MKKYIQSMTTILTKRNNYINKRWALLLLLMFNQVASFAQYKFCIENNNEKLYVEVDLVDDPRTLSLFREIANISKLPVSITIEKKYTIDNKKIIEPKIWCELHGAFDIAELKKIYTDFNNYSNVQYRIGSLNNEIDQINEEDSKIKLEKFSLENNSSHARELLNSSLWFEIQPETKYFKSKQGYQISKNVVDEDAYYMCISKSELKLHPWSGSSKKTNIMINFNYLKKNTYDVNEIVLGKVNKKYSKKLRSYSEQLISKSKPPKNAKDNVFKKTEWNVKGYCSKGNCPEINSLYPLIYEYWIKAYNTHINSINTELDVLEKQIFEAKKKIENEKKERARLLSIRDFKPTTNGFEIVNGYNKVIRKVSFSDINNTSKYGRILTMSCHLNDQKSKEHYAITYFSEILNILIRKGFVDEHVEQFITDEVLKKVNYQFLINSKILLETRALQELEAPTLGKYVLMEYGFSIDNIGILLAGELDDNIKNEKIKGIVEYEILSRVEFEYLTNLTFVLKDFWVNSFDYSVVTNDFGRLNAGEKYRYKLAITATLNETIDNFYFYLNHGLALIHKLGKSVALNNYYGHYTIEIKDKYEYSYPLVGEGSYTLRTIEGVNVVRALFDDWHNIKYPTAITDGHYLIPMKNYILSSRNFPNTFCSYGSSGNAARLLIESIGKRAEVFKFNYNYDVSESHYLVIQNFSIHKGGRHQIVRKEDNNRGYVNQYIMFPVIFYGTLEEANDYLKKINVISERVWSIASSSDLNYLRTDNRNLLQGYTDFWVSDAPKGEQLSSSTWFISKSDYGVIWGGGRAYDSYKNNKAYVIFQ
jgi:hypothetical protein